MRPPTSFSISFLALYSRLKRYKNSPTTKDKLAERIGLMVSVFSTTARRAKLVPNGAGKYRSQASIPNLLPSTWDGRGEKYREVNKEVGNYVLFSR
jgi:hypothetical protein